MPNLAGATPVALLALAAALTPSRATADAPGDVIVPLRIAISNESIAVPDATRMFASFHPGLSVGSELAYHRDAQWALYQSAELGLFHHDGVATALFVASEIGARPRIVEGLFADVHLGIGYLALMGTQPVFSTDDSGAFRREPDALHRFIALAGVAIGYAIGDVAPFVGYRLMIETPFLSRYSAVLPHQIVELGVRVELRP